MRRLFKYVLPAVAAGMFVYAVAYVARSRGSQPDTRPPAKPSVSPFRNTVAGAGIVEARDENVAIGVYDPGVVTKVFVRPDEKVEPGTPLFKLDDSVQQAQLKRSEAELAQAKAQLYRLKAEPRPEEVPVSEARVAAAQAQRDQAKDELQRVEQLFRTKAVTEERVVNARAALAGAEASLRQAQGELTLLKAGAWQQDVATAEANVAATEAASALARANLERRTVRALVRGQVLEVDVRPGEYVNTFPGGRTPMMLGNLERLHVRVDIDEYDIPRFDPHGKAVGVLKGRPDVNFPLEFVRIEPYVIPKRSLTGDNAERVDTRVLQVIYAIDAKDLKEQLFVGQQVDVYVESARAGIEKQTASDIPSGRTDDRAKARDAGRSP